MPGGTRNKGPTSTSKQGETRLNITYHAGERLIERVFNMAKYSHNQVIDAMKLLKRDLRNIEYRNRKYVPLPSFPGFYGVIADRTMVTVIPKIYRRSHT